MTQSEDPTSPCRQTQVKTGLIDRMMRILPSRMRLETLEKRSAVFRRCETIMESLFPHETREPGLECSERAKVLIEIMSSEEALRPYLDSADGDPVKAYAVAKGDYEHLEQLRVAGLLPISNYDIRIKLVVPAVLILLVATIGHFIAATVQDKIESASEARELEAERIFQATKEPLKSGQQRATEKSVSIAEIHAKVTEGEKFGIIHPSFSEDIKGFARDLDHLYFLTASVPGMDLIGQDISSAKRELFKYSDCLRERALGLRSRGDGNLGTPHCSRDFRVENFVKIKESYDLAWQSFLSTGQE